MIRRRTNMKRIIFLCLGVISLNTGFAQNVLSEKQSLQLLENAFMTRMEKSNIAINFEGISFGLKDPQAIFSLPSYKMYRGGHVYISGKKMEIKLGLMNCISDGHIFLMSDEQNQTIYIDSVERKVLMQPLQKETPMPDFWDSFEELVGKGELLYEGQEMVNGTKCHKIKAQYATGNIHAIFWVAVQTGQLYLMAEWQNKSYDVYWVKSIKDAPTKYSYTINLPQKTMTDFHGYEVFDNRFSGKN